MRGFFGFAIEASFSAELHRLAQELPLNAKLQPLHPEDYHVTLKFLSEFSSTQFSDSLSQLCPLGPPPAQSLKAGNLALWPTVLVLECTPSEELTEWHGRMKELLEARGFLRDRHPRFHPHISLVRRKEGFPQRELEAALARVAEAFRERSIPYSSPCLWRTEPDGTGRRHRPFLSPLFQAALGQIRGVPQ